MAELVVEILDYWHAGSSRGGGVAADAACLKDRHGLPYLPGRHLKGLIRDAARRCPLVETLVPGETQEDVLRRLFGSEAFKTTALAERRQAIEQTQQGALAFSDARLPQGLRARLAGDRRPLSAHLFAGLSQTAIDHERCAARTGSLRRTEVAVPLTLTASIECEESSDAAPIWPWVAIIQAALPLVFAVGRQRSRGLGRCRMHIQSEG